MITAYKVVKVIKNKYFSSTRCSVSLRCSIGVEYEIGKWTRPKKDANCQSLFVFTSKKHARQYINGFSMSSGKLLLFKCEVDSVTVIPPITALFPVDHSRYAGKVKLIEKID